MLGGMGMSGIPAMPADVLRASRRPRVLRGRYHCTVQRDRAHRGVRHGKVAVVVFFWDDAPDEWLSRLRAAGSHIFQVGSVDEAKAALRRGGQGLIVQGSEAGGHNRAAAATFSLPPAVIDAVPSVPVVAAGGIADGRTVAAALALGADPVWVGLACSRLKGQCPSSVQGAGRRCGRRGYRSPSALRSGIPRCSYPRVAQPHRAGMGRA